MTKFINFKEIFEIIKKGATLEAQEKITELREVVLKLQEENLIFKQRIAQFEKQLELSSKLTFKYPFYFIEDDNNPFCPRCWESDKKTIHLTGPINTPSGDRYDCPECKIQYIPDRKTPSPIRIVPACKRIKY